MMTQLPVRARVAIAVATVVVIAAETAVVIAAETVVVMAKTTARKIKEQKAPKTRVVRTPVRIPGLVAKPMETGYPNSSGINSTGINWPLKIPYCYGYQFISSTF